MFGSSQAFGYGDATQASQAGAKPARQEDKQTCIPVTVRILQDAVARHKESQEVLVHGVEASIVHLVGVVEALVKQSAMLEFQLNDGSGRMKVRYYSTGGALADIPGLVAGKYMSIVGNIRTSPTAHVSAMSLQPVASADEVSYHMIEVAHAALRLRNPTKASPMAVTPPKQTSELGLGLSAEANKATPPKIEAPVFAGFAEAAPAAAAAPQKDLLTSIKDEFRKVQDSEEGLSVPELLSKLSPGTSSAKVREIIAKLVDDGDAFTTIDDDHFTLL